MPGPVVVTLASIMAFSVVARLLRGLRVRPERLSRATKSRSALRIFPWASRPFEPVGAEHRRCHNTWVACRADRLADAGLENVVVVEGTSSSDLLEGPGHLRDSPLPGQLGESIVMGKSATAGAPFGGIARLRKGDVINVTTGPREVPVRGGGPTSCR